MTQPATRPIRTVPAPRVTLKVTQDIIDTACRADSGHCMIADAVREAVPDATSVSVDLQTIRFSLPGKRARYTYLTPRKAQLALLDFDAGTEIVPFSVQLRAPMITAMRAHKTGPSISGKLSDAAREKLAQTAAEARKYAHNTPAATEENLERARLEMGKRHGDHGEEIPRRVGGKAPPTGPLAHGKTGRTRNGDVPTGRRRSFGLRGIDNARAARALEDTRE